MTTMRRAILGLMLALAATLLSPSADSAALQSWRVLLVAGDDSAAVFDNAVDRFTEILGSKPGVELYRLTSDQRLRSATRRIASAKAIDSALTGLRSARRRRAASSS